MVSCRSIHKSYGKLEALHDISFDVSSGEIFGIIGPDGAGKTTLFRILTSLMLADKGTASVDGFDVVTDYRSIRKIIGYMPGKFSLYPDLTVEENIRFFASVFETTLEQNYELVKDIYSHIEPFKKRRAAKLSGGMKQKLALSCALIHEPKVLFLDEPTTGVDPVSRREFWDMLKALQKRGITILVSTPYMDEAALCDRIALIQQGRFLSIDTPRGIIDRYPHPLWSVRATRRSTLLNDLRAHPAIGSAYAFGDSQHVSVTDTALQAQQLSAWLKEKGYQEVEVLPIEAGIEDCFLELS